MRRCWGGSLCLSGRERGYIVVKEEEERVKRMGGEGMAPTESWEQVRREKGEALRIPASCMRDEMYGEERLGMESDSSALR